MSSGSDFLEAVIDNRILSVRRCLSNGVDPNVFRDDRGNTGLHLAVRNENIDVVVLLIENGADVNIKNNFGWTPLQFIVKTSSHARLLLSILLVNGANLTFLEDGVDHDPYLELLNLNAFYDKPFTSSYEYSFNVEFLMEYMDRLSHLLCRIVRQGNLEMMPLLLDVGIDITGKRKEERGLCLLHIAVQYGQKEIFEWLLDHGAVLHAKNKFGMTALHAAVIGEKKHSRGVEMVSYLLDLGLDINGQDLQGFTPLHGAARWGHTDIVVLLLRRGANVNMQNKVGNTPLQSTVISCPQNTEMIELLLAHGANKSIRNKQGKTALKLLHKEFDKETRLLLGSNENWLPWGLLTLFVIISIGAIRNYRH